jgi:hypothetical protein
VLTLLPALLNVIGGAAQSMSGGNFKISSSVQASGGGSSTGGGNKVIEGTAGQSAAGEPQTGGLISHSRLLAHNPCAAAQQSGQTTFQFSSNNYSVQEDLGALAITVLALATQVPGDD